MIEAHAHIKGGARIGRGCSVGSFATISGDPQDLHFDRATVSFAEIGDVFASGGVMLHQKIRVGDGVMISGVSAFSEDIPPYVNAHKRNTVAGINLIGMRRRNTPPAAVAEVKRLYMAVYAGGVCAENAGKLLAQKAYSTPEGENFLRFFAEPGRHYIHLDREKRR